MNHADQHVSNFGELLKQQYGFVADPDQPLWYNVEKRLGEMESAEYYSRPTNMACHNYLVENGLPPGTKSLLGLGLNYCLKPKLIDTTEKTFDRFTGDIRRKYAFSINPPEDTDGDYIKELYIKSDYEFPLASDVIEEALSDFQRVIQAEQAEIRARRKPKRNLTPAQWELIQFLKRNDMYIVVEADTNLGPCILDRIVYIRRGISEHIGNERNYRIITEQMANSINI